jgi:uncharacterized protein YndB with AHSA1/START domain
MATTSGHHSGTRVSKIIKAPRRTLFQAFLNPEALVSWLPPAGMVGQMHAFDARQGGGYRMSLTYVQPDHSPRGKTSDHTDVVQARFVELVPDERMVQEVEFETEDPKLAAPMTIQWLLAEVPGGTEVTVICDNAPEGIRPGDHEAGIRSTLENLAAYAE